MIEVDPVISPVLWITLAAASVVLLGWYALARPGNLGRGRWAAIITLMALAMALVLGVLLNPTWMVEEPPPAGKPRLTVLVDASASMATPDGAGGKTRYAEAAAQAAELVRRAGDQVEARVATFAETAQPASVAELAARQPDGPLTDVAGVLVDALKEDCPQGQAVALLTDGIQTAEGAAEAVKRAAALAKAMNVPVYVRTVGTEGVGVDLRVELRSPQELTFMGQKVAVHAIVRNLGITSGEEGVALLEDGKEIARKRVALTQRGWSDVEFELMREQVGLYPFEVRVDALPNELTTVNNSAALLLRVVDQPLKVLVVEGKPYWDAKFLVRTLALDPSVEVHSEVKVAPGRVMLRVLSKEPGGASAATAGAATQPAATQPAPYRETWKILSDATATLGSPEALREYQIVVVGRDAEDFLTDVTVANLQKWMARDGGSLVCFRGSPVTQMNQALARLLPVKWAPVREARFHLRLTEQGRDLTWFGEAGGEAGAAGFGGMPALATLTQVQQTKPLSVVLATETGAGGDEAPAVTYQPYGAGRSVVIEGAGMWRWAFLPPANQDRDEVYGALWHGFFRWLVSSAGLPPGQQMALRSDKVSFGITEQATATLLERLEGAAATAPAAGRSLTVVLSGTGIQGTRTVTAVPSGDDPGVYRVVFGKLPEGRYEAKVAGQAGMETRTLFDVRSFGEEQLDLTPRPDLMAYVANESGGKVIGDAGGDVVREFKEHLQKTRPVRVIRATAWDRWWVLAGVLALWAVAWGLRRKSGLI